MTGPKKRSNKTKPTLPECRCVTDPFAELPPEARSPSRPAMGKLRGVSCSGCGLNYWTNRSTEVCKDCQQKGIDLKQ